MTLDLTTEAPTDSDEASNDCADVAVNLQAAEEAIDNAEYETAIELITSAIQQLELTKTFLESLDG